MQCDKNHYRGILAGLEGVSGKKAVDPETMTVKNSIDHTEAQPAIQGRAWLKPCHKTANSTQATGKPSTLAASKLHQIGGAPTCSLSRITMHHIQIRFCVECCLLMLLIVCRGLPSCHPHGDCNQQRKNKAIPGGWPTHSDCKYKLQVTKGAPSFRVLCGRVGGEKANTKWPFCRHFKKTRCAGTFFHTPRTKLRADSPPHKRSLDGHPLERSERDSLGIPVVTNAEIRRRQAFAWRRPAFPRDGVLR